MSEQTTALERLVAKLPPGRARRRYEAILANAGKASPAFTPPPQSLKALKETMWQDLLAHNRWMARVYQELPPQSRQEVIAQIHPIEEEIDRAYQEGDWVGFQGALVKAKALVPETQASQPINSGQHWMYRAWSQVLDAEVWWVHCNQEVTRLLQKGIPRGAIYTEAELRELLILPAEGRKELLKSIHLVKLYFDGTVVPSER